jgi:hypothetical protein
VSNFIARTASQLLKLRPCKTTANYALQQRDPASSDHFCSWLLQSVVEGEIDQQFTGTAFSNTSCDLRRKLRTSLHSERYLPSGMLIHREKSYALRSQWCTGSRETQSREPVNEGENLPVYMYIRKRNAASVVTRMAPEAISLE